MNYSELKTAITDWGHRNYPAGKDDLFIDLFEARVNRILRVPEMEKRTTFVPAGEYQALPADFLELRSMQVNGPTVRLLEYASPQKIDAMGLTGLTRYYSLVGNEFQFNPTAAGSTVEIAYYGKITPLDNINTSNFLLASHSDYYLMGCVYEALRYSKDGMAAEIKLDRDEMELKIIRQGKNKQYGSGPLVVSAI